MSDGKTIILNRIREALRDNPAPRPHSGYEHGEPVDAATHSTADHAQREWLPKVGETLEEQIALFARQSEGLKTEFFRCPSLQAAREIVAKLTAEGGWKSIATHTTPETTAILEGSTAAIIRTDNGYEIDALEKCDAGLTGCECLIAQTGGVLVSGPSAGGRALSVLPPHHIVIASTSQMVPDLTAAFERVKHRYGTNYPSFISFITGPSRTGDIERILVLGAHGPKRLTILLVEE
jgi:L-lactate dehydrogenase complex protein LldG